jgi:hypothetical protein
MSKLEEEGIPYSAKRKNNEGKPLYDEHPSRNKVNGKN